MCTTESVPSRRSLGTHILAAADRAVEIVESSDIWLYNVVIKGTPHGVTPTYARDNKNGFMSSILAWVRDKHTTVISERDFPKLSRNAYRRTVLLLLYYAVENYAVKFLLGI